MGKRLLKTWIERPLLSVAQISKRHNAVDELVNETILREDVVSELEDIRDIERIMTRVVYKTANPRDMVALATTFEKLPKIKRMLKNCKSELLSKVYDDIDELADLYELIWSAIEFDFDKGNVIRAGYNAELDELRDQQELQSQQNNYMLKQLR